MRLLEVGLALSADWKRPERWHHPNRSRAAKSTGKQGKGLRARDYAVRVENIATGKDRADPFAPPALRPSPQVT